MEIKMKTNKTLILILIALAISLVAAGCESEPCTCTVNYQIDVYRVPDASADVWGVDHAGQSHVILARTADGWIGIDPGVAQAPNVGLARYRYFQLNAIVSPSCLESVPLVTIADVEADIAASGGP
jgi:hypothetical protein